MVISIPRVCRSDYRSMVLHGFYLGPTKVYQLNTRLKD